MKPKPPEKQGLDLEDLEVELLLEGIFRYYQYDFRSYARSCMKRRIRKIQLDENLSSISLLQDRVLRDEECAERFLSNISINVTSMFRDPEFYQSFRKTVIPILRTYPSIRIWIAGCSTGEEVYSIAILLEEEGLLKKSRIYATDIDEHALEKAKSGIFAIDLMKEYSTNYMKSGGKAAFSEYYTANYENAVMRNSLKEHLFFSNHNLAGDSGFNEFNAVLCRNVMIYFDEVLQNKVHKLFHESLCKFGLLVLGKRETTMLTDYEQAYETLDFDSKIYRRREF